MHVNFYIYLIRWNVIVYVNGYENGNANRYDYGYDYLSALLQQVEISITESSVISKIKDILSEKESGNV
jgi:hypothetical protein